MVKIPIKTVMNNDKDVDIPVEEQTANIDKTTQSEISEPVIESREPAVVESQDEPLQEELELPEATTVSEANEALEAEDVVVSEDVEEAEELDDVTRLTRQLQAKEQEVTEHYEARLRLQAEFDNFKKRKEKETADFRKYANASLLEDILMVVDDFERAIGAAEQTHKLEDFLQGVEMIFTKFLDTLQKKGVKEIEAEAGQPFNPAMHEAVTHIETDDIEEGAIAAVFQKGYYLHDRVLRAPKVGVAKPKN